MIIPAALAAERRVGVMGTTAHIVVLGGHKGVADRAVERLGALERLWSRFLPDSEVSQLNHARGKTVSVSKETAQLVAAAVEAWSRTGGAFDPTVHDSLIALGYDRDFSAVESVRHPGKYSAAPGCEGIEIDRDSSRVRLPIGVRFDPGGMGKGLTADIVSEETMAAGAKGVLVNVGGDVRTAGLGPYRSWWPIDVDEPASFVPPARVLVGEGAIASSTPCRRRWVTGSGEAHHLIDPASGRPMQTSWALVTAIAGRAWWAEAATKALMLHGPDALPESVSARLIGRDGSETIVGGFERFVR